MDWKSSSPYLSLWFYRMTPIYSLCSTTLDIWNQCTKIVSIDWYLKSTYLYCVQMYTVECNVNYYSKSYTCTVRSTHSKNFNWTCNLNCFHSLDIFWYVLIPLYQLFIIFITFYHKTNYILVSFFTIQNWFIFLIKIGWFWTLYRYKRQHFFGRHAAHFSSIVTIYR